MTRPRGALLRPSVDVLMSVHSASSNGSSAREGGKRKPTASQRWVFKFDEVSNVSLKPIRRGGACQSAPATSKRRASRADARWRLVSTGHSRTYDRKTVTDCAPKCQ